MKIILESAKDIQVISIQICKLDKLIVVVINFYKIGEIVGDLLGVFLYISLPKLMK